MRTVEELNKYLEEARNAPGTVLLSLTAEEAQLLQEDRKRKTRTQIEEALNNGDLQKAANLIDLNAGNWGHEQQLLLLLYSDRFTDAQILFDLIISVYQNDGYEFPKGLIKTAKRIAKEVPPDHRLFGLPEGETITIYRGDIITNPDCYSKMRSKVSWTINKACAVWFANRIGGAVWQGTINRDRIIAYTNERKEFEVMQYMNVHDLRICDIAPDKWESMIEDYISKKQGA